MQPPDLHVNGIETNQGHSHEPSSRRPKLVPSTAARMRQCRRLHRQGVVQVEKLAL